MDNLPVFLIIPLFVISVGQCTDANATDLTRRITRQTKLCEFQCASDQRCLENKQICDQRVDCLDGSDENYAACDCGRADINENLRPGVITESRRGSNPWHVGIYKVRSATFYVHLCSGVLIFKDAVLTSAHCLFDSESFTEMEPSKIKVAVKQTKDWFIEEAGQQKFDVAFVKILDGYEGDVKGYVKNVALLILMNPASVPGIKPICMYTDRSFPPGITYFKVSGWGLDHALHFSKEKKIKQILVPYRDIRSCIHQYQDPLNKKLLTFDKFCIDLPDGIALTEDDAGAPVSTFFNGSQVLLGILSAKPKGNTSFGIVSSLSRYLSWVYRQTASLRKARTCLNISNTFSCGIGEACVQVKDVCDGKRDCDNGKDEEQENCFISNDYAEDKDRCELPDGRQIFTASKCSNEKGCNGRRYAPAGSEYTISCPNGYGFALPKNGSSTILCYKGTWYPPPPECLKLCPGLKSVSLEMECQYLNKQVPCSQELLPDTYIKVDCKLHYKRELNAVFVNQTVCRTDGLLGHHISNCIPVCGTPNDVDKGQVLITGGKVSKPGRFPWHIALYIRNNKNVWEFKCGGTILDHNKVLTAAHCVFMNNDAIPLDSVQLVSGKFHSSWEYKDPFEQRFKVKKIILGNHYKGSATRHGQDIAVMIVEESFVFNSYTTPACLDLNSAAGGIPGNQPGYVSGWGKTETEEISNVLKETELTYLDLDTCIEKFKRQFGNFLTADKFCVLYTNKSGTQQGDSGGGLTFVHNDLHYVYGVVSIKPQGIDIFAAFTNVISHAKWLQEILDKEE